MTVGKGNVYATQFHPEKSGDAGLTILGGFLQMDADVAVVRHVSAPRGGEGLAKRVIACLDVRTNDHGDLVVTKV